MRKPTLAALLAVGALALAAPAANAAPVDGVECDGGIVFDLRPLAEGSVALCESADAPSCNGGTPIKIPLRPLVDATITLCPR